MKVIPSAKQLSRRCEAVWNLLIHVSTFFGSKLSKGCRSLNECFIIHFRITMSSRWMLRNETVEHVFVGWFQFHHVRIFTMNEDPRARKHETTLRMTISIYRWFLIIIVTFYDLSYMSNRHARRMRRRCHGIYISLEFFKYLIPKIDNIHLI